MVTKSRYLQMGLAVALALLAISAVSLAQSPQYYASELSREARESWNVMRSSWNSGDLSQSNPADRELYRAMRDFNRRARLFEQDVRSYPDSAQLRRQARALVNEARRIDDLMYDANAPGRLRHEWSQVGYPLGRLADRYNLPYDRALARSEYGYNDNYGNGDRYGARRGSMTWEGIVDGSDLIRIHQGDVSISHLEAQPIRNARFRFSSPLPSSDVHVILTRLSGRGDVELVEPPSAANNYTATVRVDDPQGGADSYAFRLEW